MLPSLMGKRLFALTCALLIASIAEAQRHKLATVNAETPEGKMLQQIGQETDAAKKLAMMEQFASQFPTHDATGWVYSQMQVAYSKAGDSDKAIVTGEKLLALDGMDVDAAYANLKASEAKKDADGVLKWSSVTSDIAKKNSPLPSVQANQTRSSRMQSISRSRSTRTPSIRCMRRPPRSKIRKRS